MGTLVTQATSTEDSIHHGMYEHIPITMTRQTTFEGNVYTTENQRTPFHQGMGIETDSHPCAHYVLVALGMVLERLASAEALSAASTMERSSGVVTFRLV